MHSQSLYNEWFSLMAFFRFLATLVIRSNKLSIWLQRIIENFLLAFQTFPRYLHPCCVKEFMFLSFQAPGVRRCGPTPSMSLAIISHTFSWFTGPSCCWPFITGQCFSMPASNTSSSAMVKFSARRSCNHVIFLFSANPYWIPCGIQNTKDMIKFQVTKDSFQKCLMNWKSKSSCEIWVLIPTTRQSFCTCQWCHDSSAVQNC